VTSVLAMGDPATEIIKLAGQRGVDLIAMTTHGHRLIGDLIYGSTADKVRHGVDVPVLLLKVKS
jgi:universal stress protein A